MVYGIAEGLWTGRWVQSGSMEEAVAKLETVPMNLGNWKGEAQEVDQEEIEAGQIAGNVHRRYTNSETKVTVTMLLVCGRPGPIAVHTPDVCYQGAGYEIVQKVTRTLPDIGLDKAPQMDVGTFKKTDSPVQERLRIYWSMTGDGKWQAPKNPRLTFAGFPVLYKLYVVRTLMGPRDEADEKDPSQDFLKVLLPAIQKHVFSSEVALEIKDKASTDTGTSSKK